MFIIRHQNFFFIFSGVLLAASIFAVAFFGLHFGIDFKGGALLEIEYQGTRPNITQIEEGLGKLGLIETIVQPAGEKGIIVRTEDLSEEERAQVLGALSLENTAPFVEKRFNSIGPVIGKELTRKALIAIVVVVAAIILFIAFAFRRVSEPVSSWKYGIVAVLALAHDVIIPIGLFAVLGTFSIEYQVNILFVTALLTILGFSVHDTIVVFDRVRENLRKNIIERKGRIFEEIVGASLEQTITRSVNTSLTVVFVMLVLYFIGGETTRQFALVLSVGVIVGTYSSIFIASPLLVMIERWQRRE